MKRFIAAILLFASLAALQAAEAPARKPNVLWFIADDLLEWEGLRKAP
jgi:hypothetical protein